MARITAREPAQTDRRRSLAVGGGHAASSAEAPRDLIRDGLPDAPSLRGGGFSDDSADDNGANHEQPRMHVGDRLHPLSFICLHYCSA